MRIDPRAVRAALSGGLAAVIVAGLVSDVAAQEASGPSLLLIDRDTRVESVRFRYDERAGMTVKRLRDATALDDPGGMTGIRRTFDFLPFVSAPELDLFDPLVLQKDVVRLRQLYRRAGYPGAAIDYEVQLDTVANRVDITFVIDEREPVLLDSVWVSLDSTSARPGTGAPDSVLPAPVTADWPSLIERLNRNRGERLGEQERTRLLNVAADWFHARGYPWADASVLAADTTEANISITLLVEAGARAVVDSIAIEGRRRLADPVLRREIPIRVGEPYDGRAVAGGEAELYELPIVTRALGEVPEQERDSTVSLRFRVEEGRARLVWGRIGWRSEAGVAGEAHWSHRDFIGGARTFTVSSTFETGYGAVEQASGRSVGVSVLARQPYVGHRTVSGTFGPFARYRDDFRDRSFLFGVETSLIYRARPFKTLTVQHELSRLRVDDGFQLLPIAELVQSGDSAFAPVFVRSVFRTSGSFGRLDDRINPTYGLVLEPRVEVTGPSGISDVDFFRASLSLFGAVPLNESFNLFLRGTAGRLFPFGDSDPAATESRTRSIVGLRGVMFTAGGTADVRGWGRGLVGSKVPELSVDEDGVVTSDRFLPVGGLKRLSASAEIGMPFPFLPPEHGTHVFIDAGRAWSADPRYEPADPELVQDGWAFSTGAGLEFGTLVGPVRISAGYKLNPTTLDLLSANQVAKTLAAGGDLTTLGTSEWRRWHLHFSIGRGL